MKNLIFTIILALILSGCAAITGYDDDIQEYNSKFQSQTCKYDEEIKKIKKNNDKLYNSLKAGFLARNCKEYELSNKFFDIAENEYKYSVDMKSLVASFGSGIGSTFLNDNTLDYNGMMYERVMINLYKALNFMALSDKPNARVELNRALSRQARAAEFYNNEILKAKEYLDSKQSQNLAQQEKEHNIDQTEKLINTYNQNLGIYQIYPNFINPFATYLSGLFFTIDGDKKDMELLQESLRMDPTNSQIKSDLKFDKKPQIWLIYENGQSHGLREERLDIPMFIASDSIYHIGMALPVLTKSKNSYLNLNLNGKNTTKIVDMDAIIKTEYAKISPILIRKELTRATLKASLQYSAANLQRDNNGNPLTALFAIFSIITTKADIRHIPVFPKDIQSASVPNLGNVTIKDNGNKDILSLKINQNKNTIIYLKSLTNGFFVYDIIEL